jgi:mono/diheme cytochrome c family protein
MKKYWSILAGASLLLLSACGQAKDSTNQNQPSNTPSQVSAPETIAKQNCSSCHGVDLEGNYGPSLQKIGRKYTKEQILGILNNGIWAMRAQKQLSAQEKEVLANWLEQKK